MVLPGEYKANFPLSPLAAARARSARRFSRFDLDGGRHARRKNHALRHVIQMDAHRHALRRPHPGEDRVDCGEPLGVRLRIRHVDAARDAVDVPANVAIAHQLGTGGITDLDCVKVALLEVDIDPE